MKPLDPKCTAVVHQIAELVGGLPLEQQLRTIGAAALMHGHYDEAVRFAVLAKQAAITAEEELARVAARAEADAKRAARIQAVRAGEAPGEAKR